MEQKYFNNDILITSFNNIDEKGARRGSGYHAFVPIGPTDINIQNVSLIWQKFIIESPMKDRLKRLFDNNTEIKKSAIDGGVYAISIAKGTLINGEEFYSRYALKYIPNEKNFSYYEENMKIETEATLGELIEKGLLDLKEDRHSVEEIKNIVSNLACDISLERYRDMLENSNKKIA